MNQTAPKEQGILLIAAVFGFIGGAVAYVAFDFGIGSAGLVAVVVALGVAIALWLGWRDPKGRPIGAGNAPTAADPVTPRPATTGATGTPAGGTTPQAASAAAPTGTVATDTAPADVTPASATPTDPAPVATAPTAAPTAPAGTSDAAPGHASEPTPSSAATLPAATAAARAAVSPSARLPGQEDLASRKGSWTYQPQGGASQTEAQPQADTGPQAHPGAPGLSEAETPASSPAPAADKPVMLDAPREGGADDLKLIKGVGPRLEETLHEMGVYHFDQIAAWTTTEVAWMDDNLRGFKGRVSRDGWIPQAQVLASGGTTEFSTRADRDGTY